MVKALQKLGARVALITPSPEEKYEPGQPGGSHYNVMLKRYSDGLKQVADAEHVPYVDQLTPFINCIEAGRKASVLSSDPSPDLNIAARLISGDGVHPRWGGHLIMAASILQGLHAPALVSSMTVDAIDHTITHAQACTGEWQDTQGGAVQFKRTDEALPWPLPVDPGIDLALKIPGFDPGTDLDRYELRVTGLKEQSYNLSIDGIAVGSYASADLAQGVNLGLVRQGPIYDQEQRLLKAIMTKNDAFYNRWRNVQILTLPDWTKNISGIEEARAVELQRLDKSIADDEQAIDELRKPTPHIFHLEPLAASK